MDAAQEKRAQWMTKAELILVWPEGQRYEISTPQRASMVLWVVNALSRTSRTRSIPCSAPLAFSFSIGLWTPLLTLSGSLLFPAVADSLTGLRVHAIFSFVVVKVRSVLRSKSPVCRRCLSKDRSTSAGSTEFSDRIGDPSSRTCGFSYSLARTDAALDASPAALIFRRSAVEAFRECRDAILAGYMTLSSLIHVSNLQ